MRTKSWWEERLSRRQFLVRSAAVATGGALLSFFEGALARVYRGAVPFLPNPSAIPQPVSFSKNYEFLTAEEVVFLNAAVARLIPTDELGPGALEVGCVLFIDRQLSGPYGRAETWYMQGPWLVGKEEQGFQSRMSPAETYRAGIRAVDAHCRTRFDGKIFNTLTSLQQDELLTELEKGKVELSDVSAKGFFALLLQNTQEGFFADPLYGGNRDMAGWRLIGFPGARYDHRAVVGQHGERYRLPPVSILGRPSWSKS